MTFSAVGLLGVEPYLSLVSSSVLISQIAGHLSPIKDALLPAGVLLALAGHFFTQGRELAKSNEASSLFYLDSSVKAYEEARDLLAGGSNDRATWIAASRALAHAKDLSAQVTVNAHCKVLELDKLRYRRFFFELLSTKAAAFFYGIPDDSITIEKAAELSSAGEERAGRFSVSTLKAISEKSLHVVWDAAQWPADYKDPLGTTFSAGERSSLIVLFPGLHEYLEHQQRFRSAGGVLYPSTPQGDFNHH